MRSVDSAHEVSSAAVMLIDKLSNAGVSFAVSPDGEVHLVKPPTFQPTAELDAEIGAVWPELRSYILRKMAPVMGAGLA